MGGPQPFCYFRSALVNLREKVDIYPFLHLTPFCLFSLSSNFLKSLRSFYSFPAFSLNSPSRRDDERNPSTLPDNAFLSCFRRVLLFAVTLSLSFSSSCLKRFNCRSNSLPLFRLFAQQRRTLNCPTAFPPHLRTA